jgi:LacI family transcriptional regulator
LRVGYLCPHSEGEVMLRKLREIYNLQRALQDLAIQLVLIPDTLVGRQRNPSARLASLIRENPSTCWVLGLCPAPVQHWFAQGPVPAIISGSAHEGVALPFFNWDHRAIGRHAAGALRTRGHRRIALLTPERRFAGDLESEAGFVEGAAPGGTTTPPTILRHDGSPEMIRRIVRSLLARDAPPTALATLHALDAVTVLTTLQQEGFRAPERMSLVSLQGDPMLEHLTPAIAHYEWRSGLLVKSLTRAILQIVNKSGSPAPALLTSRFYPAESLGRPRTDA